MATDLSNHYYHYSKFTTKYDYYKLILKAADCS